MTEFQLLLVCNYPRKILLWGNCKHQFLSNENNANKTKKKQIKSFKNESKSVDSGIQLNISQLFEGSLDSHSCYSMEGLDYQKYVLTKYSHER